MTQLQLNQKENDVKLYHIEDYTKQSQMLIINEDMAAEEKHITLGKGSHLKLAMINQINQKEEVSFKLHIELEDDAAQAALGGNWRMPTVEEFNELLRECVWYWVELNGVQGYKVISFKTEKSIFLPAVGIKSQNNISGIGTLSSYWTNTLSTRSYEAERLFISNGNEDELGVWPYYRWMGCPIRPVYAE